VTFAAKAAAIETEQVNKERCAVGIAGYAHAHYRRQD